MKLDWSGRKRTNVFVQDLYGSEYVLVEVLCKDGNEFPSYVTRGLFLK